MSEHRCWRELSRHHEDVEDLHLQDLFAADPDRGERFVAEGAGLCLDYSKNRITEETIELLGALAEQSGVAERRDAMFAGEHVNVSEDRARAARRTPDPAERASTI